VVDQSEPNAFAVPGGRIVITRGLLESVSSESELAFVLGHEIGHFKQRDHLRGLGRGLALGIAISALDLGGAGGALDLVSGATGIAGRHFDRSQESGADEIGLELVWREYGHVSGALKFFDRFPRPTGSLEKQFQSYLATHPVHSDRIASLRGMADARGWRQDGTAPALGWPD
jgi:predicted Zn-dependent protease